MRRLRALTNSHRAWFALLLVCTLAVRLVVPSGFMPSVEHGRVTILICSGTATPPVMATAMSGMHHDRSGETGHTKAEMPCAFAGLGLATMGTAPPLVSAAALLLTFLLAILAIAQLLPAPSGRLRPPLRAPPLHA